jgi:hypothetical protein
MVAIHSGIAESISQWFASFVLLYSFWLREAGAKMPPCFNSEYGF